MKAAVLLALCTMLLLILSSFELTNSQPISYFDVQREQKNFELQGNESLVIINHTLSNVQRISIELTVGTTFSVNYSIPSDTRFQKVENITGNSHIFELDGVGFFILLSPKSMLKGWYEIDYGTQASYA